MACENRFESPQKYPFLTLHRAAADDHRPCISQRRPQISDDGRHQRRGNVELQIAADQHPLCWRSDFTQPASVFFSLREEQVNCLQALP